MPQTDDRRDLIRHCAEKVMGWAVIRHDAWESGITADCVIWGSIIYRLSAGNVLMEPWDPTRNGSDTMQLWEKAGELGIEIEVYGPSSGFWDATAYVTACNPPHKVTEYRVRDISSGEEALTLAVAKATGFVKEPKNE